jgi:hypothetical protein
VLIAFTLSLIGAYLLCRHLTGNRAAAAVAAIMFAYCPYVFARTAHIQLLMIAGLPLSLLAFHRFVERRTPARVVALAVALVAQALCCGYYGIFSGLTVGLGVLFYAVARGLWRDWRYWLGASAAALLSVAAIAPFFLPYLQIEQVEGGQFRSIEEARAWSANWQAYLASGGWGHRWLLPWIQGRSEVLFPGVLLTGLAASAVWMAIRSRLRRSAPIAPPVVFPTNQTTVFYALVAVLAFWISFGPVAGLYTLLYRLVPVFSFLRAPARFGVMVALAGSVLSAMALTALLPRLQRPRLAGVALAALAIAELGQAPVPFRAVQTPATIYQTLATLPREPVVELPFFYRTIDFHRHCLYMLNSTVHWQPLTNGYSDHIPDDFREMVIPVSTFPSRESFTILRRLRARYAVFHLNFYDRWSRPKLLKKLEQYREHLRPLAHDGDLVLYEIVSFPPD